MIGLALGVFVTLFGCAIIENAAFSDRAQFGFYVAAFGVVIVIGAVIDLTVAAFS